MHWKNQATNWNAIQAKVDQVLGDDFWQEISEMIPILGPRIDAFETKEEIYVIVELPGIDSPEHVSIKLQGTVLHIQGTIPSDYPPLDHGFLQAERYIGAFSRKINLPNYVYLHTKAKLRNGLLTIQLTKSEPNYDHNIPVETN